MKTLNELRQEAAKLRADLQAILDKAEEEGRATLTEEEDKRYGDLEKQRKELLAEIESREKFEARRKETEDARKWEAESQKTVQPPDVKVGEDREAAKPFKSFGEQLLAVREACDPSNPIDKRLLRIHEEYRATGLSEGVPADGGFLVQTDFASELLKKTYELGAISSRVKRIPISANANGLKINAIKETSRAAGSRWGGIRAYWTDEAGTKTASQPEFRQMELNLNKLTGLCYATDELLQDAAAIGAVISDGFANEFSFKIEDAIINGTGAGQPLGILTGGGLVTVAKETGQAAATIVYDNIVKMWARGWARSRPSMVWLINQDVEPELFNMGLVVGTGGTPAYMPPGGLSRSPYSTLFGRPVIPVEYCATLGTLGDIILIDLAEYLMIEKGGMQAASSIHVRFIYDETTFRFVYRCDGQPIWNSALTPYKGTNTVSPYVVLAART